MATSFSIFALIFSFFQFLFTWVNRLFNPKSGIDHQSADIEAGIPDLEPKPIHDIIKELPINNLEPALNNLTHPSDGFVEVDLKDTDTKTALHHDSTFGPPKSPVPRETVQHTPDLVKPGDLTLPSLTEPTEVQYYYPEYKETKRKRDYRKVESCPAFITNCSTGPQDSYPDDVPSRLFDILSQFPVPATSLAYHPKGNTSTSSSDSGHGSTFDNSRLSDETALTSPSSSPQSKYSRSFASLPRSPAISRPHASSRNSRRHSHRPPLVVPKIVVTKPLKIVKKNKGLRVQVQPFKGITPNGLMSGGGSAIRWSQYGKGGNKKYLGDYLWREDVQDEDEEVVEEVVFYGPKTRWGELPGPIDEVKVAYGYI